jgi:protein-disulfide isomerase
VAKASQAVANHRREIFNDPSTPVGGNPQGNETIVEFFDYRCPYCKRVEPSVDAMLRQDPNLRLVYKEFPILGPVSVTAAVAALAAQRQGKYDAFHAAMMEARGNITDDTVYRIAASVCAKRCTTFSGARGSFRQAANRSANPSRRSTSRNTSNPPSEDSRPPSKRATTALP